jgi:hypothetical protein
MQLIRSLILPPQTSMAYEASHQENSSHIGILDQDLEIIEDKDINDLTRSTRRTTTLY